MSNIIHSILDKCLNMVSPYKIKTNDLTNIIKEFNDTPELYRLTRYRDSIYVFCSKSDIKDLVKTQHDWVSNKLDINTDPMRVKNMMTFYNIKTSVETTTHRMDFRKKKSTGRRKSSSL